MSGEVLDSSVTLEEILIVVGARRVPLAPELAGYLALEMAEQAVARDGSIDPRSVFVGDEGTVAIARARRDAGAGDAEASIREALSKLLEASGSQTPALAAATRRRHVGDLRALAEELEAALIPVNRAAARRALARLAREVKRATPGGGQQLRPATPAPGPTREDDASTHQPTPSKRFVPSESEVDALLSELAPMPSSPPPRAAEPASDDQGIEALLAMSEEAHDPPSARDAGASRSTAPAPAAPEAGSLPTQPSPTPKSRTASRALAARGRGRRGWAPVVAAAVVIVGTGAYVAWKLRPGALAGARSSHGVAQPAAPPSTAAAAARACLGTLVVTGVPARAEVLLREGPAPLDVPRMPVGARLEFVATAAGYAPRRVVVPATARWAPGPDGRPRFEAAVQLDPSHAPEGAADPWPAGEPGTEVGGQGPPGTVHIVATPPGAEVWMLAGIGPEAHIEQIACDRDLDVLLAGPTTYRKRLHVTPADFVAQPAAGNAAARRVAHVDAR